MKNEEVMSSLSSKQQEWMTEISHRMRQYPANRGINVNDYEKIIRECYLSLSLNESDSFSLSDCIELKNYDGDKLCYYDVVFDIKVPNEEIEIPDLMHDLTQLLLSTEDKRSKHCNNGYAVDKVTIDQGNLVVAVDSKENVELAQQHINELFGEKVKFNKIIPYSIKLGLDDKNMNEPGVEYLLEPKILPNGKFDPDLTNITYKLLQLKSRFLQIFSWNLQRWRDVGLLALDNQSPREVIKTPEGAALVEEILTCFERNNKVSCWIGDDKYRLLFDLHFDPADIKKLRILLS